MVVFNKLKYIFRYKISTNTAKENIDYIRKHLDKNEYIIISDYSHLSTSLDNVDYYVIIGRCSVVKSTNFHIVKKAPNYLINSNSAMYHSLLGNNGAFLRYYDIPIEKRLNGTWTYSKYNVSQRKKRLFNYKTCHNWYVANTPNKKYSYENKAIHLKNEKIAQDEVSRMFDYVANKNIVVAPFNKVNDVFINTCKELKIQFIISDVVYSTLNNQILPIHIIDIEQSNIRYLC